jgi:four helix bundle protein
MATHKDLNVWKNSMGLVKEVYKVTLGFPKHEIYGLTNQIRRAAVSVPANISEGSARMRPKEFHSFLRISFGSLSELETLLIIAMDLDYLKDEKYLVLHNQIKIISSQLSGLIHAIEKRIESS